MNTRDGDYAAFKVKTLLIEVTQWESQSRAFLISSNYRWCQNNSIHCGLIRKASGSCPSE